MVNLLTLDEAREYVYKNRKEGVDCPCCGQLAKEWREPIHAGMGYWLFWLVKEFLETKDWVHVSDISKQSGMRGGDYAKLQYWGLIVPRMQEKDPTKRASGFWKPTHRGIQFARGISRIPKYTITYDKVLISFDGDSVLIQDVLKDKFDFREIMEQLPPMVEEDDQLELF